MPHPLKSNVDEDISELEVDTLESEAEVKQEHAFGSVKTGVNWFQRREQLTVTVEAVQLFCGGFCGQLLDLLTMTTKNDTYFKKKDKIALKNKQKEIKPKQQK